MHPEDRDEVRDAFLAANARQEPFRLEYRLRRADGAWRWAIDVATPRFGEDGAYLGYVGSVIDITERKAVEDERERLVEALSELTDTLEVAGRRAHRGAGRRQTARCSPRSRSASASRRRCARRRRWRASAS